MSAEILICIDPGVNGAVAIKYPCGSVAAYAFDTEADMAEVVANALEYDEAVSVRAILERVHSSPQMGVASAFKFGANYGFWRGVLQALRIPFTEVTPQHWQRGLLLSTKLQGADRKRALLQLAKERFPGRKVTLATADALLMTEAGV